MKGRLQLPMYTAAALTAANPVLLKGEIVYESDTGKRKVGDGMTAWNNLAYEAGGGDIPEITPIVGADSKADFLGKATTVTDALQKVIAATNVGRSRTIALSSVQGTFWYPDPDSKTKIAAFGCAPDSQVLIYGEVDATEFPGGIFGLTDGELGYMLYAMAASGYGLDLSAIPPENIAADNLHRFVTDAEKATWNGKANSNLDNVNLAKSLLASGYYKAPDGLMIQWGYTTTASATPTVYFPTSFYGTPFVVIGSIKYSASNPPKTFSVSTTSMYTSYATFLKTFSTEGDTNSAVSEPFYWIAIGRWK